MLQWHPERALLSVPEGMRMALQLQTSCYSQPNAREVVIQLKTKPVSKSAP